MSKHNEFIIEVDKKVIKKVKKVMKKAMRSAFEISILTQMKPIKQFYKNRPEIFDLYSHFEKRISKMTEVIIINELIIIMNDVNEKRMCKRPDIE